MRLLPRMPLLLALLLPGGSPRAEPPSGAGLRIHLDDEARPVVPDPGVVPQVRSRATVPAPPEQPAPGGGRMIVLDGVLQKSLEATVDGEGRVRTGHGAPSPDSEH